MAWSTWLFPSEKSNSTLETKCMRNMRPKRSLSESKKNFSLFYLDSLMIRKICLNSGRGRWVHLDLTSFSRYFRIGSAKWLKIKSRESPSLYWEASISINVWENWKHFSNLCQTNPWLLSVVLEEGPPLSRLAINT